MTISPGNYDITIYQGANFNEIFTWRDENNALVNLTGFSARMMARATADAPNTFISLASGNGITLGGAAGTISLSMSAAQTAVLNPMVGVYDLEIVDGAGQVSRLLQGSIFVSAEVTR